MASLTLSRVRLLLDQQVSKETCYRGKRGLVCADLHLRVRLLLEHSAVFSQVSKETYYRGKRGLVCADLHLRVRLLLEHSAVLFVACVDQASVKRDLL